MERRAIGGGERRRERVEEEGMRELRELRGDVFVNL